MCQGGGRDASPTFHGVVSMLILDWDNTAPANNTGQIAVDTQVCPQTRGPVPHLVWVELDSTLKQTRRQFSDKGRIPTARIAHG